MTKRDAQWHIDHETDDALDVAADCGQIFANVAHMSWFVEAVQRYLDTGNLPSEDES